MPPPKRCIRTALFLLLSIAATPVLADTVVEGQIRSNGSPLPFAIVGVEGTTYGAQADAGGAFVLKNLPPGEYTFVASSMGYRSSEVRKALGVDSRRDWILNLSRAPSK